ncbi:MAG: hypothetical protein Q8865_02270 [Bacillota bacterium]|nr:hypothetical protein [Bacillota bacterium]
MSGNSEKSGAFTLHSAYRKTMFSICWQTYKKDRQTKNRSSSLYADTTERLFVKFAKVPL